MRLRAAVAEAITSAGYAPARPQEVSRGIGLNKNLAWRLAKLVGATNGFDALAYMPGKPGVRIVVAALRAAGTPEPVLAELDAAVADFDRLVATHAGGRDRFAALLADRGGQRTADQMEELRRAAFHGNRAIWGVSAGVKLSLHFAAPSATPGMLDLGIVSGLVEVDRARPDVSWPVATMRGFDGAGQPAAAQPYEAVDPDAQRDGLPLLSDFCTATPQLVKVRLPSGAVRYALPPGPVGKTGATTFVAAWMLRGRVSATRTERDDVGEHFVTLDTPTPLLVHDLYAHRSMIHARTPEVAVYSQLPSDPPYPSLGRETGRLAAHAELIDLGQGPPDCTLPEYPALPRLVAKVCAAMGHDPADFFGVRFRLTYPPLAALAVLRYPLPVA